MPMTYTPASLERDSIFNFRLGLASLILFKNGELMKMPRLTIVRPETVLLWQKVVWLRLKLTENRLAILRFTTRFQDTD